MLKIIFFQFTQITFFWLEWKLNLFFIISDNDYDTRNSIILQSKISRTWFALGYRGAYAPNEIWVPPLRERGKGDVGPKIKIFAPNEINAGQATENKNKKYTYV